MREVVGRGKGTSSGERREPRIRGGGGGHWSREREVKWQLEEEADLQRQGRKVGAPSRPLKNEDLRGRFEGLLLLRARVGTLQK